MGRRAGLSASGRLHAAAAPLRLVAARLRASPARPALVALGIAIAVALLGGASGAGTLAGERAARQTLAQLPPDQRSVRVGWSGGLTPAVERRARGALSTLARGPQTRSALYLATRMTSGPSAQLAAIAPLTQWVRLTSGRLPRACTRRRCEVVQVGGAPVRRPLARLDTTVEVVGRGTLTSTVPLGFVPVPDGSAVGRPPLLVGADPDALDTLSGFGSVFRSHGWSAALELGARPSWRLDALGAAIERTGNALSNADVSFSLRAPTDALRTSADRAAAARRRLLLVGAGAASLLGAFALLVAGLVRRDLDAERARLQRRGAGRAQLLMFEAGEALAPALAGVLGGAVSAVAVTAVRASGSPVPVGTVLSHALLGPAGVVTALACWLVAAALIVVGSHAGGPAAGRVADVAALAAAAALAVVLSRGGARAGDAGDPLPTLLVPMVLLVAALVLARLAPLALRAIEVAARRGPLALRLAALGAGRSSSGAAATIALVALACALGCFAFAYRATLDRGATDEAAFRVPLDVTVRQSGQSAAPLAVAPAARWRAIARGGPVLPVLRRSGSVPGAQSAISVLGVPARELGELRAWRDDLGSTRSRQALGARLLGPGSSAAPGVPVRAGDGALALRARSVGDAVDLVADLVGRDGSVQTVSLGRAGPAARSLRARLPSGAAGRTLVALEAAEPSGLAATGGHARAESSVGSTTTEGRLVLGRLRVGGRTLDLSGWCGAGPLRTPTAAGGATVAPYAFDVGGRALLHPCSASDGRALPILADPVTARSAGRGGALAIVVDGSLIKTRVVGTLARMPSVAADDAFVVADEQALANALTAVAPGSAQADELWIGATPAAERRVRAALRRPPSSGLALSSRRALLARLRTDPLARELSRTLAVAAGAALVLAAAAVLLAALVAVRDEGAELYELEATGADPALLRASVRLRAALLAGLGMLAGVLIGLALLALLVDAVQVTAAGRDAFPPLVPVVPWATWTVGAIAFALTCAAIVAVGTARGLSGSVPRRVPAVAP